MAICGISAIGLLFPKCYSIYKEYTTLSLNHKLSTAHIFKFRLIFLKSLEPNIQADVTSLVS
jgi:hypothetical protein